MAKLYLDVYKRQEGEEEQYHPRVVNFNSVSTEYLAAEIHRARTVSYTHLLLVIFVYLTIQGRRMKNYCSVKVVTNIFHPVSYTHLLGWLGKVHHNGYMRTAVFASLFIYPLVFVTRHPSSGALT